MSSGRAASPSRLRVRRGALEHYTDPAYYTRTYRRRRHDVAFYLAQAKRCGGPVLEYGIGNGRVALPIVRAGIDVVGVDLSRPMLDDLERRAARLPRAKRHHLDWVHGDMRAVRLARRFALVIAPFNTVLHLYDRGDIERFLAGVRSHLAPDASFVFDFSTPIPCDLADDPPAWRTGRPLRVPGTTVPLRYRERFDYDAMRQILNVDIEFATPGGAAKWYSALSHRQFFPREMEAWLHYNGFSHIRFTADFTRHPPDASVDSLVVEARC